MASELQASFNDDGYYVWREAISVERTQNLRELVLEMAAYEREIGEDYQYPFDPTGLTQRVWNLTNKNKKFTALLEIRTLAIMMDFIFKRPTSHQLYHLSSFQANILNPGASKQKLHIDTPFPEPIPPWPAKANSIWCLDDFTPFNGATEVIPGSHKFDHKPTQAHHDIDATPVTAPKGSIIFTHGNLWHRAGANKTRQPRVALLCSFAASFMKEIASEEDQSLVIGEDVKQGASDQLRAILGVGHGIKEGAFVQHERLQTATSGNNNPSL